MNAQYLARSIDVAQHAPADRSVSGSDFGLRIMCALSSNLLHHFSEQSLGSLETLQDLKLALLRAKDFDSSLHISQVVLFRSLEEGSLHDAMTLTRLRLRKPAPNKHLLVLFRLTPDVPEVSMTTQALLRFGIDALDLEHMSAAQVREAVAEAIRQAPQVLARLPASFCDDRELVLSAVKQDGKLLKHAGCQLRADRELVRAAILQNSLSLEYAGELLRHDKQLVMEAVMQDGNCLQFAGDVLREDPELVLEALSQDVFTIRHAGRRTLLEDKAVVLQAVRLDGKALLYVDEKMRMDREVVLEAVKNYGPALNYAAEALRDDKEVVLEAVRQTGLALRYASERLREDREVVLEAVLKDKSALRLACNELRKDEEMLALGSNRDGSHRQDSSDSLPARPKRERAVHGHFSLSPRRGLHSGDSPRIA
ncbi:unnamed protein product [Polarella glacialis]|uniref:DUF4116 domain-containing protein n=1 Tax=Polarella glacialis TaxID=89957 RepID=A0A813FPC8_POLGL|nr:unnamed protein product [Polarella glacialis]